MEGMFEHIEHYLNFLAIKWPCSHSLGWIKSKINILVGI
jgi:hypothetical protein